MIQGYSHFRKCPYACVYVYIYRLYGIYTMIRVENISAAGLGCRAAHIADGHHLPISDRCASASRLRQRYLWRTRNGLLFIMVIKTLN